jgi:hypothetical protein
MRDWTGTRIRAEAEQIPCRDCHAPAGETCRNPHMPDGQLHAFPAHTSRINDSQKEHQP